MAKVETVILPKDVVTRGHVMVETFLALTKYTKPSSLQGPKARRVQKDLRNLFGLEAAAQKTTGQDN